METMTHSPIILIADRSDDVLNCLRKGVETTGCALVHAKDGKEALNILGSEASHVAAAVVELELPVVNGLDVIARLTSLQPKPKIIIATTFLEYEPLLELAKYMGADEIVRKPVPEETWIETVRQFLREYAGNGHAGTRTCIPTAAITYATICLEALWPPYTLGGLGTTFIFFSSQYSTRPSR